MSNGSRGPQLEVTSAAVVKPSRRSESSARTRILLVTDVRLFSEGLRQLLSVHSGISEVYAAATLDEAILLVARLQPTVVLLHAAALARLDAVQALAHAWSETKVIAFAVSESEEDVVMCAEAGVAGYVPRNGSIEDLVTVVESAARGEVLCSPRAAATLFRRLASLASSPAVGMSQVFTTRERQIANLLCVGLTNKEIARQLNIEVATVKNHVHHVLEKLQVHHRAAAAARLLVGEEGRSWSRGGSGIGGVR